MSTNSGPSAKLAMNGRFLSKPSDRQSSKYALDLALVILVLPVAALLIAFLYVMVRLDGGPGFFGHVRIGRNGKAFRCWKIRTMVTNSAEVLERHLVENPDAAAEWSRDFKLRNDPRVTRLGNFLRRSSLDELPQLWNVIRGEMSLVGPRPVTRAEIGRYGAKARYYFALKPGVTGLWQVSGRNDVDYDSRVDLDVRYYETRSLLGDLGIVFQTARVVLARNGH
jgi:lipopolysaccharide/colanic/teichoic acid biosynthesis glycosyltransferase